MEIYIYKTLMKLTPTIQDFEGIIIFIVNQSTQIYKSTNTIYKSINTNISKSAFSYIGPKLWREVPLDLKFLNHNIFGKRYKRYLHGCYLEEWFICLGDFILLFVVELAVDKLLCCPILFNYLMSFLLLLNCLWNCLFCLFVLWFLVRYVQANDDHSTMSKDSSL